MVWKWAAVSMIHSVCSAAWKTSSSSSIVQSSSALICPKNVVSARGSYGRENDTNLPLGGAAKLMGCGVSSFSARERKLCSSSSQSELEVEVEWSPSAT